MRSIRDWVMPISTDRSRLKKRSTGQGAPALPCCYNLNRHDEDQAYNNPHTTQTVASMVDQHCFFTGHDCNGSMDRSVHAREILV